MVGGYTGKCFWGDCSYGLLRKVIGVHVTMAVSRRSLLARSSLDRLSVMLEIPRVALGAVSPLAIHPLLRSRRLCVHELGTDSLRGVHGVALGAACLLSFLVFLEAHWGYRSSPVVGKKGGLTGK